MNRNFAKALAAVGLASLGAAAMAQTGWSICIDPSNQQPYSPDFGVISRANELIRTTIGGSGTVAYGGQNSPCFTNQLTFNAAGRIGFGSGPTGSIQSDIDDDLMYTFGMPNEPAGSWSYATIIKQAAGAAPTSTLWNAPSLFFSGNGDRYIIAEGAVNNVAVKLRADILGDAVRLRWDLQNLETTAQSLGLWYGAFVAFISDTFGTPPGGEYITIPGRKPIVTDRRLTRTQDPVNFPTHVQFGWSQANAYGMQVDLGPTPPTRDSQGRSDATNVDELVLGSAFFLIGAFTGNDVQTMPDFVFGDAGFNDSGFIVKYQPSSAVAPNATRRIIQYVRNTWSNARYAVVPGAGVAVSDRPFSTVIDAPKVLVNDDQETGNNTNGLVNNPFTVRIWIDNIGGYSRTDVEVPLNNVHVRLNLPPGMTFANGENAEKIIPVVQKKQMTFVEWTVESDGIDAGDMPYSASVWSVPGPPQNNPMVINGTIRVAATKKIRLLPQANLISSPWVFNDSSWQQILGLNTPQDFTAYDWDPVQNSYVVSTSATRGKGTWIVLNPNNFPTDTVVPYNNAVTPPDTGTGAPNIQLKGGWNLIGNPYQYAFPVGQLVGVPAGAFGQSRTWSELVAQGIVNPYLAYWDPTVNNYRYIQAPDGMIQPNRGYWIKVNTSADLTLNFPAIYDTFVPTGGPGFRSLANDLPQTATSWALNLKATADGTVDDENFLGVVPVGANTRGLQVAEPPMGPGQGVTLTVAEASNAPDMARVVKNLSSTMEWTVRVKSTKSGNATISWPNAATIPTNVTLFLVDPRTNQGLNMKTTPSANVQVVANQVREFKVRAVVAGSVQTPLGVVSATNGRVSTSTPSTIRFNLNRDAVVTVKVLNSAGNVIATIREEASATRGENTAIWNLRNSNGALVPWGSYKLQVTATADGVSSTKTAPFTVAQ